MGAVLLLIFLCNLFLLSLIAPSEPTERFLFLYRSSTLLCGSSPTLTLLLLISSAAFWLHSHFGRLAFYGHRIPSLPKTKVDLHCPTETALRPLTDLFQYRDQFNIKGWNGALLAGSAAVVTLALFISGSYGPSSLAHSSFDWWVRALSFVAVILMLHDAAAATCGWILLRTRCLLPLSHSPLRWGFTTIKGFSWRRIWTSYRSLCPEVMFEYFIRLDEANRRTGGDQDLRDAYDKLRAHFRENPWATNWAATVAKNTDAVQMMLGKLAEKKLESLNSEWEADRGPVTGSDAERGLYLQKLVKDISDDKKRALALDRMGKEEFVALLYLGYIQLVLIQIRNRVLTALVMYILLLWALTSYPWMNHHSILIGFSALLVVLSAAPLLIYSQMHRDDILSRTTETTSGKLDLAFFGKIIPTIGLPLLTLIASQVPELNNFIVSWLQPGLRGQ